ncbi:MAG: DUF1499 domain-containing protein [Planctomycetota bacterium]|jgi:uncharacterized protein (DUF1499 family)
MDDRDQFLDGRTESHAQLDQPGSFCQRYIDPFGQLAPQDPVLCLQVLDVPYQSTCDVAPEEAGHLDETYIPRAVGLPPEIKRKVFGHFQCAFYCDCDHAGILDWARLTHGVAECPSSPNCVSTQASVTDHRMEPIPFTGSPDKAMQRIKDLVAEMPRAKIVTMEDSFLHAEFRSSLFRFVDDVEFLIDPEEQVLHFRSASRVGHSDFG